MAKKITFIPFNVCKDINTAWKPTDFLFAMKIFIMEIIGIPVETRWWNKCLWSVKHYLKPLLVPMTVWQSGFVLLWQNMASMFQMI